MRFEIVDLWRSMGPVAKGVVVLLCAMSVVAVSIGIDRLLALGRFRRAGRRHAALVAGALSQGRFDDAAKVPGEGPLSRVVGAGLREHLDVRGRAPSPAEASASVDSALSRAIEVERAVLRRGLGSLATIGTTAPFVGLFGTIVGIIDAFREIAKTGSGGLGAVSGGIAEALVTTGLGILVAVVAVVVFNVLSGRVDGIEADLADASGAVLDHVRKSGWGKT